MTGWFWLFAPFLVVGGILLWAWIEGRHGNER